MAVVPAGKRGHHSDFALTQEEIKDLLDCTTNPMTKAMILLASLGLPVRGIVAFKASLIRPVNSLTGGYTWELWIESCDRILLNEDQVKILNHFPNGFGVTNVTVWRRIKREIVKAGKEGVIFYNPDHVPFPAALASKPSELELTSRQMVTWCLERIHHLQSRVPNQEHGTPQRCPHKDCERVRRWLNKGGVTG